MPLWGREVLSRPQLPAGPRENKELYRLRRLRDVFLVDSENLQRPQWIRRPGARYFCDVGPRVGRIERRFVMRISVREPFQRGQTITETRSPVGIADPIGATCFPLAIEKFPGRERHGAVNSVRV